MIRSLVRVAVFVCLVALGACEKYRKELVVLQPDADGKYGSVVVQSGSTELVLDGTRTAAHRDPGENPQAVAVDDADVRRIFGTAIDARPKPPRHFRLYFVFDSDLLTRESQVELDAVFDDIRTRGHYDVEVVGHTDRRGATDYNRRLSLQRAQAMRQTLIDRGLDGGRIIATGRGEVDPLVPTGDNVEEIRNRRVEITVR